MAFLFMVAVGGIGAFWLLAPRFLTPPKPANSLAPNAAPLKNGMSSPLPSSPQEANTSTSTAIPPPFTPEQQSDIAREQRRAPYYSWLLSRFHGFVAQAYADVDRTVLVVELTEANSQAISTLFEAAIVPYAAYYGFLHVRFTVPDLQSGLINKKLYAEAALMDGNQWKLFFR